MPLDYGQHRKHRPRGLWLALVPAALGLGAILALNFRYHRDLEREQGWVGEAAPCPAVTPQAYRARYAAHERATVYDQVTFARQFGHVMCADVDTPGAFGFVTHPVCQFTSPTAIRVKGPAVEAYFAPGPGHLATVSVEGHRVRCALGGKFNLFNDPTN